MPSSALPTPAPATARAILATTATTELITISRGRLASWRLQTNVATAAYPPASPEPASRQDFPSASRLQTLVHHGDGDVELGNNVGRYAAVLRLANDASDPDVGACAGDVAIVADRRWDVGNDDALDFLACLARAN